LFLDTDQNPSTGDVRIGHLSGVEYRISALVQALNFFGNPIGNPIPDPVKNFMLWQLPKSLQEVSYFQSLNENRNSGNSERSVYGNDLIPIERIDNLLLYRLSIPLQDIGNPSAVDVVAITHLNQVYNKVGDVDRAPDGRRLIRKEPHLDRRSMSALAANPGNTPGGSAPLPS
jgi:hypothetical protein